MSTGQFFSVVFICAGIALAVLCIAVPVLMWVHARIAIIRAQTRQLNYSTQWARDAEELLGDVYANIKSGNIVAPQEIENQILDVYSQGKNTYRRKELS